MLWCDCKEPLHFTLLHLIEVCCHCEDRDSKCSGFLTASAGPASSVTFGLSPAFFICCFLNGLLKCVPSCLSLASLFLLPFLSPAEIEDMISHQSRVFTADSLERVSCRPPRGQPEPEVWWERGGRRLPAEGRVYQDGQDLVFSPTRGEDSGSYFCFAENKAGQRKQELTVTVASQWNRADVLITLVPFTPR